jgi:hypothetical protein
MTGRSASGIHFDEIRRARPFLDHEIEADESRQAQSACYLPGGGHHLSVIDQSYDSGRTEQGFRIYSLAADPSQNLPFPTDHGAVGRTAGDKRLGDQGRPDTPDAIPPISFQN